MIYCEARPFQNADEPNVHHVFRGRKSAHLMADTEEELIEYASEIGLRASWIQKRGKWDCHFDIVGRFLQKVLADPRVVKLSREAIVEKWREKRNGFDLRSVRRES